MLSKIKDSDKFRDIVKTRIDVLNYELLWSYNKSLETKDFNFINSNKIKLLCAIYNFDTRFLDYNTDILFTIDKIKELMIYIIKDLVDSLDYEIDMVSYLIDNICNKSQFFNMTCLMKHL